ncbi:MAG: hypothetical protein AB7W16_23440 [Candidatus Obscuribacterales bacterium]
MEHEAQITMYRLEESLPEAIAAGDETLVSWIGDFASLSVEGAKFDAHYIANLLEAAGYQPSQEEAESKTRVTLKEDGAEAYRRRLIQFAYHFIKAKRPVPEDATIHADYYFEATGAARIRFWERASSLRSQDTPESK